MLDGEAINRVSHALIADRVPVYRWLRSHPYRQWKVPWLEVAVDAAERGGSIRYDLVKEGGVDGPVKVPARADDPLEVRVALHVVFDALEGGGEAQASQVALQLHLAFRE